MISVNKNLRHTYPPPTNILQADLQVVLAEQDVAQPSTSRALIRMEPPTPKANHSTGLPPAPPMQPSPIPFTPWENLVRKRLPEPIAQNLLWAAELMDYCRDRLTDSGIDWELELRGMQRLTLYHEGMQQWLYGTNREERLRGLFALRGGKIFVVGDEHQQLPPLTNETFQRRLDNLEFEEKYFGGHYGPTFLRIRPVQKGYDQKLMQPTVLHVMRCFADRVIGPQIDLAAARAAAKRAMAKAHEDKYRYLSIPHRNLEGAAKDAYTAIELVRKLVEDEQYGPALYAPRRLWRGEHNFLKLGGIAAAGVVVGLFFSPLL